MIRFYCKSREGANEGTPRQQDAELQRTSLLRDGIEFDPQIFYNEDVIILWSYIVSFTIFVSV